MKDNVYEFGQHIATIADRLDLPATIVNHDNNSMAIKVRVISLKKKERLLSSFNYGYYKKLGVIDTYEDTDGILDDVYFRIIC
ncbi:hypothetical protein [Carboxylicivirga sp. M1479]|uniref:hypothetical protein n=1 Tax=Carboxylicivirga sp. M1479 TaxID=2594476 RepID=UPI0011788865|nr:hypothetical protein [Carboxylicivirga sp. M1479]TRX71523.1 hypothetical protein FNN09_06010 [Carboxylicivirga sp. M1479]